MRKPDPDDLCICSHARYAHIALTDGCTLCEEKCREFKRKVDIRVLADICTSRPSVTYMRISRRIAAEVIELCGPYTHSSFTDLPTIFGKYFSVDDEFAENEFAFGDERMFIE